jgi:hypothetical protein
VGNLRDDIKHSASFVQRLDSDSHGGTFDAAFGSPLLGTAATGTVLRITRAESLRPRSPVCPTEWLLTGFADHLYFRDSQVSVLVIGFLHAAVLSSIFRVFLHVVSG